MNVNWRLEICPHLLREIDNRTRVLRLKNVRTIVVWTEPNTRNRLSRRLARKEILLDDKINEADLASYLAAKMAQYNHIRNAINDQERNNEVRRIKS